MNAAPIPVLPPLLTRRRISGARVPKCSRCVSSSGVAVSLEIIDRPIADEAAISLSVEGIFAYFWLNVGSCVLVAVYNVDVAVNFYSATRRKQANLHRSSREPYASLIPRKPKEWGGGR